MLSLIPQSRKMNSTGGQLAVICLFSVQVKNKNDFQAERK
jgi:hypothetical protein